MLFAIPSHAPRIDNNVLPTPAEEWALSTEYFINSVDSNALVLAAPRVSTPGPPVPGAYPFESEVDYSKGIAFNAKYHRTRENVKRAVLSTGATAKQYLPGALGSYFPETRRLSTPLKTSRQPSPIRTDPRDLETSRIASDSSPVPFDNAPSSTNQSTPSLPDDRPSEDSAASISSLDQRNGTAATGMGKSFLTPHTDPDADVGSISRSNVSTRTINGSPVSSGSEYSSRSSLIAPNIDGGAVLSSTGTETADTEAHDDIEHHSVSEKAEGPENGVDLSHLNTGSGFEGGTSRKNGLGIDTPIEGPYPAFLGPVDTGSIGAAGQIPSTTMAGGVVGVEYALTSAEPRELQKARNSTASDKEFGVQQPTLNTQARILPSAGIEVKGRGVALEEPGQEALDYDNDRPLRFGSQNDTTSPIKPAYKEITTQHIKRGAQGPEDIIAVGNAKENNAPGLGLGSGSAGSRHRRTSAVATVENTPAGRNLQRSYRAASDAAASKGTALEGSTLESSTSPGSVTTKASRGSFMDKLKGEMKIISGKLSNNEAKVEQGRRMMGKTA